MVVVDLTVNCPKSSGTSVLRSLGLRIECGERLWHGVQFGAVAKALKSWKRWSCFGRRCGTGE